MQIHEAANIFPLDEENIQSLADDIRQHGQQETVKLLDGAILDGRRRFKACELAGVEVRTEEVKVPDPVAYVLSLNLHRRHLTPSQAAMVGARARKWYDDEAKKRQQVRKGKQPGATPANLPDMQKTDARDAVGKVVGVSGKSIDYASRVIEKAEPEVVQAVDEGRMAVSTAALLATEPPEVQVAEATKPKRNRTYISQSHGVNGKHEEEEAEAEEPDPDTDPAARKIRGKGITLANEAINCLIRIPKNDALRKRGLQLVTDWIKRNR